MMAKEAVSEVEMFIPLHRIENAEKKLNRLAKTANNRGVDFTFNFERVNQEYPKSEFDRMKEQAWEALKPSLKRNDDGYYTRESESLIDIHNNNWRIGWKQSIVPPPQGTYGSPTVVMRRRGSILTMKYGVLDTDWRVIAVLEPAEDAYFTSKITPNFMVNTLPSVQDTSLPTISEIIPHSINSLCEHCNTVRRRSELIVSENVETGEVRRVGSTCLQEYTNIDPAFTMKFFSYTDIPSFGDPTLWKKAPQVQDLYEFLERATRFFDYRDSYVKGMGRTIFDGWITEVEGEYWMVPSGYPTKFANMQGFNSFLAFTPAYLDKYGKRISPPSEKIDEMVVMMISYIMQMDARSDFEHNLKRIVNAGVVSSKTAGYAASIYTVYRRAEERGIIDNVFFPTPPEASEEDELSQHMGSIGDRLDFEAQVIRKQVREGFYGETTMMVFQVIGGDYDGSEVIWWSSSSKRMPPVGDVVMVRGTIKKHGEFKGKKTTTISRAKITEI